MVENPIPFLIASSVTEDLPQPFKYSLEMTIGLAQGKADGTQLYINSKPFEEKREDIGKLRYMLSRAGLLINVAHLPGYATSAELTEEVKESMQISSKLLSPDSTPVGKVLVIHHDPLSGEKNIDTVRATADAVYSLKDPNVVIGLENFYPKSTTQEELDNQVDQYVDLLGLMHEKVPTVAVLDVARLFASKEAPAAPLYDPEYKFLEKMVKSVANQPVLIHGTDKKDVTKSFRIEGNAVPLGTGAFTPAYRKLAEFSKTYGLNIIGVVDETTNPNAISNKATIQDLFR